MEIDARQREVLAAIVREYILTGEAVGSRTLVKRQGIEQSPATVRNTMADLEERGLLRQPHASAGRLPTESGLRFFVDRLMRARELTEAEKAEIVARYRLTDVELQALMREISRLLSDVSQQCALVLVPRSEVSVLKRIDFVPLDAGRLLAVLVMSSGLVQNRLLKVRDLDGENLGRAHRYLNDLCVDKTLSEVRQLVQNELENEQSRYDKAIRRGLELGAEVLDRPIEDELVIEGQARLLDHPDFDREQLRALLEGIEQRRQVLQLLDETMGGEGVQVFIGAETQQEMLRNCAIVAASYGGNQPLGTLGVIGPSSLDYSRVISLVDFTAGLLTKVLS
ncbi:MAG: heat-inducible transcription repressor HrcA [Deltaproteobacteria bacterium]|nr:MAG: heat-inducible transcription repressor HrcA [Pseudomonadota bacterium]PIE65993.1 MAG: heat-inducible transcription repressor HrcA [Deltaproteobacteria bacterium]